MGLGHVSPCPLCEARQRDDLPRREHRGARANRLDLNLSRQRLARLGECIAASFLQRRGAVVVGRNVRVGNGEVDLLVELPAIRAIVEVKTLAGAGDPIDNLTDAKVEQLRRMGRSLGSPQPRIDFVGVSVGAEGARIRWVPGVE